jgi:hypothetical protein
MFCGAGYPATVVNFHWNKAFALGGQVGKVEYNDNTGFAHDLLYTLNFSFANAHQGSGSMTAVGGYDMGGAGGVQNCSVSFNFNLNWTGPEF